jgi:hypothetical protein
MSGMIPSDQWVVKGGWNIADCAERSYDVEGMHVGTVAAGRRRPRTVEARRIEADVRPWRGNTLLRPSRPYGLNAGTL